MQRMTFDEFVKAASSVLGVTRQEAEEKTIANIREGSILLTPLVPEMAGNESVEEVPEEG